MAVPTAGIVIIGDEILSGKFAEENAAYLVQKLRVLGTRLVRIETIPDVVEEIAESVRRCSEKCDHVFTSGGVGPTHDDLTMEGIARAFGVKLVRHPQIEALLRGFYGKRCTDSHLRMAEVPEGAELVPGDHPSWPVTQFRNLYILPGVPWLFRRKFDAIKERFRTGPYFCRRVYCMTDEGNLAPDLNKVVAAHPEVAFGSYPRFEAKDYRVIVTIEAKEEALVEAATRALCDVLPEGVVVRCE